MSFGKLAKDFHRCLRSIHSFSDKQAHVLDWDSEGLKWLRVQLRPKDGPYQSGMFDFLIHFDSHYPTNPPSVTCMTTIYHPNIDPESSELNVCLNLLDEWQSTFGIEDIIQGLLFLLKNPNLDDPLSPYFDPAMDEEEFLDNVSRSIRGETLEDVSVTFLNVCVNEVGKDAENQAEVIAQNEVNVTKENTGEKEETDVGENKSTDGSQIGKDGEAMKGGSEEIVSEIISMSDSDSNCDILSSETETSDTGQDSDNPDMISFTSTESDDSSFQSVLIVTDSSDLTEDKSDETDSDDSDDDDYDGYTGLVKTESEQLQIRTEKQLAAIYSNMLNKVEKIVNNLKDEDFIEPEIKDEDEEWEESEEDTEMYLDSDDSIYSMTNSDESQSENSLTSENALKNNAGLQLVSRLIKVPHTDPLLEIPLIVMAVFAYDLVRKMLRS